MSAESDALLKRLQTLRKQTGITPIPLTEEEKRSGIFDLFATTPKRTARQTSRTTPAQEAALQTREAELQAREAVLKAREAALQARETLADKQDVTHKEATDDRGEPTPPHPSLPPPQAQGATPSKRAARHMAVYKRTGKL